MNLIECLMNLIECIEFYPFQEFYPLQLRSGFSQDKADKELEKTNMGTKVNPVKFCQKFFSSLTLVNEGSDTTKDRVIVYRESLQTYEVMYFEPGQTPNAFTVWLSFPQGTLAAMRRAGDKTPVSPQDMAG